MMPHSLLKRPNYFISVEIILADWGRGPSSSESPSA